MRVLVLVLSLLLGAAAPAWAQSPPADWKLWRYPDLHMVLRAPGAAQPEVKHATLDVAGRDGLPAVTVTNDQIVVLDGGQYALMVGVSDWSGNTRPMSIQGVIDGAVAAMKVDVTGPVRTRAWPGGEAREYDAMRGAEVVRCRIIIVHRRVYQIMALSLTGQLPADTDAFIASVMPD